ncbi:Sodium-coupled neutral amino acid transporter 9 [Schistosoma japonicum]|nr:Sodium-coupled neutral amino acid transporter 9 [Schistosoma japonicum]
MAELKRYSSSSTETASVSDSPGSNTPANKSPKSTKLEVPTENHHAHYYFFNQHDTERNSNKEVVKENITESDKNSHNLNDINKTHQPSTNTSLVRSVENNKVNSSEVKQKINDINLSHNYHELTTSLSDVNMNTEKMFSHNINSKSDNFPIGSIIEIHSEYDSKLNDQPKPEGKQSSIITIFTIWNTIMGTSILVMPWAIQQAGFTLGIFLILFVAFIAWYCGYLVLKATEDLKIIQNIRSSVDLEFTDVCLYHLGKPGYILALSFSMLSLIGAIIVYYVLMCNFLYYTGDYIYHKVHSSNSSHLDQSFTLWNKTYTGATCSNLPLVPIEDSENIIIPNLIQEYGVVNDSSNTSSISTYNRLWSKTRTVPGWLLIVIIPLISIKSPTFLGKFSALGTICVLYLVTLVCLKAGQWGINMDFSSNHPYRVIPLTITYLSIGLIFYCSFPLAKSCIEDNLLNNLVTDIPVFIGRFFSLLQMFTVFPIILYVLRVQIMTVIFKKPYPGFSGSLCGLVYMFTLPPLMYLLNKHAYHRLQLDSDGGRGDNQKKTEIHSEKLLNNKHVLGNKVNNKANDDHIPFNEFQLDNRSDTLSIVRIKLISEHETLKWWFIVGIHVLIMLLGLLNFIGQFSVFFTSSTNTK